MKSVLISCLILGVGQSAVASTRTFTAINEKATVDLQQVPGEDNRYYVKVTNLDFPLAGQTLLIDRNRTGSSEEFRTPGLGFSVRLGGQYAKAYTKPPTAGTILFGGRDIPLKSDDRQIDLAKSFIEDECLHLEAQEEAQKELLQAETQLKAQCGKGLKIEINWKSFKEAARACNGREFLEAVTFLCKDIDYKEAISKLAGLRIESGEKTFSKDGKVVVYRVGKSPTNTFAKAKEWLEKSL